MAVTSLRSPGSSKLQRLGPDFYVVARGTPRGQTKWVAWEEGGLLPTTIIEFVSPSTESRDRGHKFCVYRDTFKTEDYFIVEPDSLTMEGFHLSHGHYVALTPTEDGWFWIESLGLWMGPLEGWIRLHTKDGQLLTTGREVGQQERQRAEQAEARLRQLEEEQNRLKVA